MPFRDDEIDALKSLREAKKAEAESAQVRVSIAKDSIDVMSRDLAVQKAHAEQLKKTRALTQAEVKGLKDKEDAINKAQKALTRLLEKANAYEKVQKEDIIILNQRVQLYGTFAQSLGRTLGLVEDQVLEYGKLKTATKAATDQVLRFTSDVGKEQKALSGLKDTLLATRKQFLEFQKHWVEARRLGVDTKQLDIVSKKLVALRGQAIALERIPSLISLEESAPGTWKAMGGDQGNGKNEPINYDKLSRAFRAANPEQRQALSDTFQAQQASTKEVGIENTIAKMNQGLDNLKSAFQDSLQTSLGPLAGLVTPTIAGMAGIGSIIIQLKTANRILHQINEHSANNKLAQAGGAGGYFANASMRGAKYGGIAAGAGLAISTISNLADPKQETAGGKFATGVGNVLGSAGTGASVGAAFGPQGAIIGGIIGAGYGLITSYNDLKEASDELMLTTEQRRIKELDASLSMDALSQANDNLRRNIQGIMTSSELGVRQKEGKVAEKIANQIGAGGGDISGQINTQLAGRRERVRAGAEDLMSRQYGYQDQKRELQQKHVREMGAGTYDPERARAEIGLIDEGIADLTMAQQELLDSMDFQPFFQQAEVAFQNSLKKAKSVQDIAEMEMSVLGGIDGTHQKSLDLYKSSLALSEQELAGIEKKAEIAKKAYEAANGAYYNVATQAGDPGARKAAKDRMDAAKQEYEIEQQNLEQQKKSAQLAKVRAATALAENISLSRTQGAAYVTAQSERGLGEATTEQLALDPTQTGAAYQMIADAQRKMTETLIANHDSTIEALQAEADATTDLAAKTVLLNKINEVKAQTLRAEIALQESNIKTISAVADKERSLISVRKETAETQLDLANYLGSSYSTIFDIQKKIVEEKRNELNTTVKQMEKMKNELGAAAENNADYQALQVKYQKEAAELTKASLGIQRDFLDKALGKVFGASKGSKFSPVMNDRMAFGDFMKGPNGMAIGSIPGGPKTIGERETAMNAPGARVPLAPGFGGVNQPGQFGQPANQPPANAGQPIGPGGGMRPAIPAQPVQPAQMAVRPLDISGMITVKIELNTDMLTAFVDKRITLSDKRGARV
jgi:hypothetical protein